MSKQFYSSYRNPRLLKKATLALLEGNSEALIQYIYDDIHHQGLFGHPEVRIGLSIKLLHNLKTQLDENLLQPILKDIEDLLRNEDYLASTGNADQRRECLLEEYHFVQKYLDLDDNMTLNTEYNQDGQGKWVSPTTTTSSTISSSSQINTATHQEDSNCVLM